MPEHAGQGTRRSDDPKPNALAAVEPPTAETATNSQDEISWRAYERFQARGAEHGLLCVPAHAQTRSATEVTGAFRALSDDGESASWLARARSFLGRERLMGRLLRNVKVARADQRRA